MDSRESLRESLGGGGGPPQSQHHHHHPPPGMMMAPPPNSYNPHIPNNNNGANNNNSNSSAMINPNSATNNLMQQNPRSSFPFNSDSLNSQYGGGGGDGSSPAGGFRAGGFSIEPARKKRGRPRKYSPNPSPDGNIALGLAPSPISITPGGGGGSGQIVESNNDGTPMSSEPSTKKHRGRPPGSGKKQLDALGNPGVGFTPHVINVKAGEDISEKILAFTQQGPRSVCILSANGAICNVTLRQPAMSGGTVSYEGRFEIISLSGSFVPSENSGSLSRSGSLSVSLAGSDGRVLGGGVAGMLLAATPVQVVVGSFIADGKKSKSGPSSAPPLSNMLNFGGSVPGVSPPSEGPSSESSDESGSSPLHRIPGAYNNASQPMQSMPPMYSNMGWLGGN